MHLAFIIAVLIRRNDVADVAWGLGFIVVACLAYALSGHSSRSLLVTVLVTMWGLRLSFHIFLRNRKKPEDHRYALWRKQWRHVHLRSYVQIFMLQGILLFVIAFPVMFIAQSPSSPLGMFDVLGSAIWLVGFFFESVGDYQLTSFVRDPENKGKIMDRGLWRYSRHPNYFGEVTQWWGIFVIALSLPGALVTSVSPLLITVLILFVSGVPMLEKKYAVRPDFESYRKRTSMFIPLPPRKGV